MYANLEGGYNHFESDMLARLHASFPDRGIEVTPGRENSVVVRFHVPIASTMGQVRKFVEDHFKAAEVEWETAETLRIWWD